MSESHARRELDAAWQTFVLDGKLPRSIRPEVLRSWQRAQADWQIDPGLVLPRTAIGPDELGARLESDEVFRIASPLMKEFADRLAPDAHAVVYIDATGVILTVDGNHRSRGLMADANFAPGACYTEESAGTTAIAIALIEARPVEVFASEHFVSVAQPWSCASAPVCSGGRVLGVVDITSPWTAHHPNLLICAEALARAIESRVDAVTAQRSEAIRAALRESSGSSGWLGVDLHGRIVEAGPTAGRDARALPASVLAPVVAELRGAGARPRELDRLIDLAGRPVRVVCRPVEHGGRVIGAILREAAASAHGKVDARHPRRRRYDFDDVIGAAPALQRQVALARTIARNALPVLIVGESGTGKELFAQAVHSASERAQGPFVALNCGAIPESLVEAELFGYEPGAFTGGRKEGSRGRVEDADGGTLFLDEVSELSMAGQTALLRILEEREVTRIGSSKPRAIDFRLVAASNKDLQEEIRALRFRQDLFYRLNVLRIELPALRSRREDVRRLADHYLALVQLEIGRSGLGFAPDTLAALAAYDWPGNIRELKNVVERSAVAAPGPQILVADLPPELQPRSDGRAGGPPPPAAAAAGAEASRLEAGVGAGHGPPPDAERAALERALETTSWNVGLAARTLGVSRRTMYRRLGKHGLTRA